jgi:putative transposase
MVDLCRECGISRKTGYKLWRRFQKEGPRGLFDRSRAPERVPNRTSDEVRALLLEVRKDHPTWGPRKILGWLEGKHAGVVLPAPSTVGDLLRQHGLVQPRRRRRSTSPYAPGLTQPNGANDVWCADFKGQFRLGSGAYCYPLTITDRHSRFLLACEGLEGTRGDSTAAVFDSVFQQFGLPTVIRTDNGTPFASNALLGLSRLSVRWLRLGIRPERIEPAHPEQNGQHERMHRVLKAETTRPAAKNMLQQQERFDRFVEEYNHDRPHEALGQRPPGMLYQPSPRRFVAEPAEPQYPLHDERRRVGATGHLPLGRRNRRCFLTEALAGEYVGLREFDDRLWLVSFMELDLGVIDVKNCRFTAANSSEASMSDADDQAEAEDADAA